MKEIEQNITGSNNLQVAVNNGKIVNTKQFKNIIEVVHDPSTHITVNQAYEIKQKITDIASMVATNQSDKASAFKREYIAFGKQFKIPKYNLLPAEQFDDAILWLNKRTAYHGKKNLRQGNTDEWRKKQYTAIYARIKSLNMTKEDLLIFAEQKLALKSNLESIKDLSDTRLQKLYKYIIAIKPKA
ncbi:hypothetical protein [Epilithonimonas mollis]|uniref:Uncharacterized protein n=1 Tax=Epilithonimonas mollis TaxID=216903 RepID=A0A1M6UQU6_9FLAO|nr:hypothetical protein [Epilithonimonas mollis]SHK71597.1 hypothetical protein SAMN05444371_3426 [Epilithonimonas mollis]